MSFYKSIALWYDYIFPLVPAQSRFVEVKLKGLKEKVVLDAGCSTGKLSALLAKAGARVVGIDLDEELLKIAREQSGRLVEFKKFDLMNISKLANPEFFDGIVCFGNTLVHLPIADDILSFFKQSFSLLKPGGFLLVQIINYDYVLDNLTGLPTIENEHVFFERKYFLGKDGIHVDFKTRLQIKSTGEIIENNISLFPVKAKLINKLFLEAGFSNIEHFSSFDSAPIAENSIQRVMAAGKDSKSFLSI